MPSDMNAAHAPAFSEINERGWKKERNENYANKARGGRKEGHFARGEKKK